MYRLVQPTFKTKFREELEQYGETAIVSSVLCPVSSATIKIVKENISGF